MATETKAQKKKRLEAESAAKVGETETKEQDAADSTDDADTSEDSVDIIKRGTMYIRSFSKEVHGEDFEKLAEQLVNKEMYGKREYKIVPSSSIPQVEVRYREKADFEKSIDEKDKDAPIIDKERRFTDKQEAISFNIAKKGTIVIVKTQPKVK